MSLIVELSTSMLFHLQFCFKLEKNLTETSDMLTVAFRKQIVGRTQVLEWFS